MISGEELDAYVKESVRTECPWLDWLQSRYGSADEAKKDMNITIEEEELIKNICVSTSILHANPRYEQ